MRTVAWSGHTVGGRAAPTILSAPSRALSHAGVLAPGGAGLVFSLVGELLPWTRGALALPPSLRPQGS